MSSIEQLIELLARLRRAKIHFTLEQFRDDSLAVSVAVPGERWEIEVMSDGSLEIERFRSDGAISGEEALEELFKLCSDE
jgi:hypothetical protein